MFVYIHVYRLGNKPQTKMYKLVSKLHNQALLASTAILAFTSQERDSSVEMLRIIFNILFGRQFLFYL